MAGDKRNRPVRGGGSEGASGRDDRPDGTGGPPPQHVGPTLLDHLADLEEGRRRRDDGVAAVRAATATGWRLHVDQAITDLAAAGVLFTAEDVRELAGDPLGSSPNALGGAIHAAARAGLIQAVGYRQATRPEAHARVLRVWQGVMV